MLLYITREEEMEIKKIGVLTGGGDCPGLNPVIRAVVKKASKKNIEVVGILDGWKGLRDNLTCKLGLMEVSGILHRGGTIIGTSRTNPYKNPEDVVKVRDNYKKIGLNALIAIGGEDTLGVATKLCKENLNVVGVPKTIDNDLSETDYTFGFDTAINIVMECLDRLHTTAESHHRVLVAEIMGRHAGWITLYGGIAGGADVILVPEKPIDLDKICETIDNRKKHGKHFSIIAVAEGAELREGSITQTKELDAFGHIRLGGIGERLAKIIEEKTKAETRHVVLGHIQRGGSPTAFDRILGTRFGLKAVDLVLEGKFGYMVGLQGLNVVGVPIEKATAKLKTLDKQFLELIEEITG
jgi:6-phosphofructokinase 1